MATGKARCTRKLRNWIVEQVESGQFPGVCWDDAAKTMFRIPWKHAGKQDFREDQDAAIFKVRVPEATVPRMVSAMVCPSRSTFVCVGVWIKAILGSRTNDVIRRAAVENC